MIINNVGPDRKFKTITEAYNYVNEGDILLIDEGIYYENLDFDGKCVHLIANTSNPGTGKILIESTVPFYIRNLTDVSLVIDGISFKFNLTIAAIRLENSIGTSLIFNRSIINMMYKEENIFYIINSTNENINLVLYNCKLLWLRDTSWGIAGADNFVVSSNEVNFKIERCI